MKFVAAVTIFCLLSQFSYSQIVNEVGNALKKGAATQATDYNRTRSNKEHLNNRKNQESSPENSNPNNPPTQDKDKIERVDTISKSGIEDEYVFTNKVLFKLSKYNDNQATAAIPLYYSFNDSVFMLCPSETGLMINDYTQKKTLVLEQDSKSGISSTLLSPDIVRSAMQTSMGSMYSKTGKTRDIAGFTCEEYSFKSPENAQINVWVSKTNPVEGISELSKFNLELFFMNFGVMSPEVGSITMGFELINEGKTEISVVYESFSAEVTKINLGEYQIVSY